MVDWLWGSQLHHYAIFHQNQSNDCGDIVIVRFFKMVALCRLDFQNYKF